MSLSRSRSPSPKRVRRESSRDNLEADDPQPEVALEEEDEDRCSICLQGILDRTVVPLCAHEFCFDCLVVWTGQSRRCPLCSQGIGDFLIHKIRSRYDYQKHYLAPLSTSPVPLQPLPPRQDRVPRRRPRERHWGARERSESAEADRLEQAVAKRRWIYEHHLYAKHVASNAYTRYRPYPTPAQFAASSDLISRTTMFLRRELQVWVNLDVEFLTNFTISIMKAIDVRSESAVKLLAEFLDLDEPYVEGRRHPNAEHFAHEVYSYVRSPYKDLFVYDSVVQYDTAEVPELIGESRHRWRSRRSVSPERSARDPRPGTHRARDRSRSQSSHSSHRYAGTSSRDRRLDAHTSRGSGSGGRKRRNASRSLEREAVRERGTDVEQTAAYGPCANSVTEIADTVDPKGKSRKIGGRHSGKETVADARRRPPTEEYRRSRSRSRSRSPSIPRPRQHHSHSSARDGRPHVHNSRGNGSNSRQRRSASRTRESEPGDGLVADVYTDADPAPTSAARNQHSQPERPFAGTGVSTNSTNSLGHSHNYSSAKAVPASTHTGNSSTIVGDIPSPMESAGAAVSVESTEVPISVPSVPPRKLPRARHRSLFESVHAHLSLPMRKDRMPTLTSEYSSSKPVPLLTPAARNGGSPPPSLLGRLSDPGTAPRSAEKMTIGGTGLPLTPVEDQDAEMKILEASSASGLAIPIRDQRQPLELETHSKPALSSPEIKALTRARHARLAAKEELQSLITSLDGGVGAVHATTAAAPSTLSLGSRPDGLVIGAGVSIAPVAIGDPTSAISTRRSALLRRLEEEKQKAHGSNAAMRVGELHPGPSSDAGRISQRSDATVGGESESLAVSSATAEARLRRQAQLRVRLAAEKRKNVYNL